MRVVESFAELRSARTGVVGLVPTLGYLHEGHLSLMERAVSECDLAAFSIFVNPLQFGPDEDYESYPRSVERDVELAASVGIDLAFVPPLEEMYPIDPATRVNVHGLDGGPEGSARPGHFEGVATVVTKLLAGAQPDRAYFGRKDAQQLALIERMTVDLSLPVSIVGCPTVREADGLALSSRNVYLSPDERVAATALSRGLFAAADAIDAGERSGAVLEGLVATEVESLDLEYVQLTDRATSSRLDVLDRDAFLALAARVGSARLIDNIHVFVAEDCQIDRGVRLEGPSILGGER